GDPGEFECDEPAHAVAQHTDRCVAVTAQALVFVECSNSDFAERVQRRFCCAVLHSGVLSNRNVKPGAENLRRCTVGRCACPGMRENQQGRVAGRWRVMKLSPATQSPRHTLLLTPTFT